MGELYPDQIDRALMLEEKHCREKYRVTKEGSQIDNLRPKQEVLLSDWPNRLSPENNHTGVLKH